MSNRLGGGDVDGFGMMLCFVFMVVGFLVGCTITSNLAESDWEARAVRHGAARYNEKTAGFEWINPEVPNAD